MPSNDNNDLILDTIKTESKMQIEEIKKRLSSKTVGIAGCGGLGSNCAVAMARVGIGRLIIVDFDVIVESNLNRQYFFFDQIGQKKVFALAENIRRINPLTTVTPFDLKLGPDEILAVFGGCDLIVEAFDQAEMKEMIVETVSLSLPSIPLIVGNGMAGLGKSNQLRVEKLSENLFVCGDGCSEISAEQPPLAPRVGIVANMQANMALQILLGNKNQEEL
jgi:sulfur carrier protein ThiS adenylyltransferase